MCCEGCFEVIGFFMMCSYYQLKDWICNCCNNENKKNKCYKIQDYSTTINSINTN